MEKLLESYNFWQKMLAKAKKDGLANNSQVCERRLVIISQQLKALNYNVNELANINQQEIANVVEIPSLANINQLETSAPPDVVRRRDRLRELLSLTDDDEQRKELSEIELKYVFPKSEQAKIIALPSNTQQTVCHQAKNVSADAFEDDTSDLWAIIIGRYNSFEYEGAKELIFKSSTGTISFVAYQNKKAWLILPSDIHPEEAIKRRYYFKTNYVVIMNRIVNYLMPKKQYQSYRRAS